MILASSGATHHEARLIQLYLIVGFAFDQLISALHLLLQLAPKSQISMPFRCINWTQRVQLSLPHKA